MTKKLLQIILLCVLQGYFIMDGLCQSVVINEVCTSPPPTSSTTNANSLYNTGETPYENKEWVELYNPSPCNSVDISCYTLGSNMLQGGTTPNWGALTFPSGTIIPPLGFMIIGGNQSSVPTLDFNTTYYRQTYYQTQYLDGDPTRWFLRDEYGWIALYDVGGSPVDAVYWDAYGNASNLYSQGEYQENVVTSTACSGTQTLASAASITGIEYVGAVVANTLLTFQRVSDGSPNWHTGPVLATPHTCNGPCVQPQQLSCVVQNESCVGGDGSINLNITDGHTGPYTTNWLNPVGVHTNNLSNLSAGTYIVQVVDASGCFIVYDTVVLTKMPDPSIIFQNIVNETCEMSNGSVQAGVINGNAPVSFVWNTNPPNLTSSLLNMPAGNYTVTITDHLGCTATNSVSILDFPGPQIHIDSIKNEMCSQGNGAIYTNITGGTSPLSYVWNSTPPQHNQNLTGVHASHYTVIATDANGCSASADITLTNKPPPMISVLVLPDTCNKRVGALHVSASGGHPPYSYNWSCSAPGNPDFIANLSAGNYTVSVADSFCVSVASVYLENMTGPKADFTFYPPVATIENPTFRFEDWSFGIIDHWFWDFGDNSNDSVRDPIHRYDAIGTYPVMLKITNYYGCVDSIIKEAIVIDKPAIYIPNCFTPNGDGINDQFFIVGLNITDLKFYLYDRWGELIYTSTNIEDHWTGKYKGKVLPDGIYNWVVFYSEDYAGIRLIPKTMTGLLTILR